MLMRYELHNHTTHSDAGISCLELIEHMEADRVDVVALTDHNTISGHREMKRLLDEGNWHVRAVYGMEYTTYYGHILCLNLLEYVPWDKIDRNCPEKLFAACRAAGALTGVAHPFSYGAPFARGCRFEMKIHDFTDVDFIEIFNDLEPLHEVNEKGLRWWEDLVLSGERLAATCGMDLHGPWDMAMQFATYLDVGENQDVAEALQQAILTGQTWVSKGMIVRAEPVGDRIGFQLQDMKKPGFVPSPAYTLTLRDRNGEKAYDATQGLVLGREQMPAGPDLIVKLFAGEPILENLICVAPVLHLKESD